jgi:ABC-2 type transport system permease protein
VSLRRTLAITRRLLTQFRHDHRTLALLFVAPILILGIFALLFENGTSVAALGVENLDRGGLGSRLVTRLQASELVAVKEASRLELNQSLEEGDLDGFLVLPADLTDRLTTG